MTMRFRLADCLAHIVAYWGSYQFNPDLYNPDVVINILAKALAIAPAQDFNLCLALTGERSVRAHTIGQLLRWRKADSASL